MSATCWCGSGPAPGLALVGPYGRAAGFSTSVCRYFYGTDAEARAADLEPKWRAWLTAQVA
ncbi:MAG: hypothetical protein SFX73_03905 [Kofleriaceae bacterium]|nr:hypothetical protein [Kofleriaceae bacterium]